MKGFCSNLPLTDVMVCRLESCAMCADAAKPIFPSQCFYTLHPTGCAYNPGLGYKEGYLNPIQRPPDSVQANVLEMFYKKKKFLDCKTPRFARGKRGGVCRQGTYLVSPPCSTVQWYSKCSGGGGADKAHTWVLPPCSTVQWYSKCSRWRETVSHDFLVLTNTMARFSSMTSSSRCSRPSFSFSLAMYTCRDGHSSEGAATAETLQGQVSSQHDGRWNTAQTRCQLDILDVSSMDADVQDEGSGESTRPGIRGGGGACIHKHRKKITGY